MNLVEQKSNRIPIALESSLAIETQLIEPSQVWEKLPVERQLTFIRIVVTVCRVMVLTEPPEMEEQIHEQPQ